MSSEKAILAGGCFWGVEELIRALPGVNRTVVGYSGGDVKNATYRNHGTHAEAIAVNFDPEKLSYRKLLECWLFLPFLYFLPQRRTKKYSPGINFRNECFRQMAGNHCYRSRPCR